MLLGSVLGISVILQFAYSCFIFNRGSCRVKRNYTNAKGEIDRLSALAFFLSGRL